MKVGEIKDYYPRLDNIQKILAEPEEFMKRATKALMARRADGTPGLRLKEAKEAAAQWLDRVRLGNEGVSAEYNFGETMGNLFTQSRTLGKEADAIMGDFYLRNPADVIPAYLARAGRAAEYARRFGPRDKATPLPAGEDREAFYSDPDGKLKDIRAEILNSSRPDLANEAMEFVRSVTGNRGSGDLGASGVPKWALNMGRTVTALSYLPHATFSSLAEPVNIAIKTGNVLNAAHAYGEMVNQTIRRNSEGAQYWRRLASALGVIGDAVDEASQLQRIGGEGGGLFAKRVTGAFFKANLLTWLTEINRIASVKIGTMFLRELSHDVASGSARAKISKRLLSELGVEDHEGFARYVGGLDKPNIGDLEAGGVHGEKYQQALSRFVGETVMHPNAALKPRYAQHPVGGLIFSLQSFNYTMQKQVLNRVGAMAKAGVTEAGLTPSERVRLLAPLMNIPALMAVTWGVLQVRDAALKDPARAGQPPMSGGQEFRRLLSRSGVTGSADGLFNAVTSAKYSATTAGTILGPGASIPFSLYDDYRAVGSDRNSPNTNTTERKLSADTWKMVVQPTLEAGMLAAVPQARLIGLGTAGIVALANPRTREAVVGATAGPRAAQ